MSRFCIVYAFHRGAFKYYLSIRVWLIATLGSILDSQLIWESGKFQLARWSHNVALFSWDHPPPSHPPPTPHPQPTFFDVRCPPHWPPVQNVCAVSLPPCIHFFCVPPSNVVLCLWHIQLCLGFQVKLRIWQVLANWESCKFQLARWNNAQLVSSSVALLAELVNFWIICPPPFRINILIWEHIFLGGGGVPQF